MRILMFAVLLLTAHQVFAQVKAITEEGKEQYIYIDPINYYALRMVILRKQYGLEEELASDLSNYQKLPEGIVVPMTLKIGNGTLRITKVEVNQPVDEKIFTLDNQ